MGFHPNNNATLDIYRANPGRSAGPAGAAAEEQAAHPAADRIANPGAKPQPANHHQPMHALPLSSARAGAGGGAAGEVAGQNPRKKEHSLPNDSAFEHPDTPFSKSLFLWRSQCIYLPKIVMQACATTG